MGTAAENREARRGCGPLTVAVDSGSQVALLEDVAAFGRANGLSCSIERHGRGVSPFVVFLLRSGGDEVLGSNPMTRDSFSVFFRAGELRNRFLGHMAGKAYVRRLR
jgi:hypothetical protein